MGAQFGGIKYILSIFQQILSEISCCQIHIFFCKFDVHTSPFKYFNDLKNGL